MRRLSLAPPRFQIERPGLPDLSGRTIADFAAALLTAGIRRLSAQDLLRNTATAVRILHAEMSGDPAVLIEEAEFTELTKTIEAETGWTMVDEPYLRRILRDTPTVPVLAQLPAVYPVPGVADTLTG